MEKKHNGGDVSSFEEVIKKSKVTLLYWSPYDSPNPIARVWCLFEILLTLKKGNKLSVFFREKDMENLYVVKKNVSKKKLNLLVRSCNTRNYKLYFQFHGKKFFYLG